MRRISKILIFFSIFCTMLLIICGCDVHTNCETGLLRVHIRANSNERNDQSIKLLVRDAVSEYLIAKLDGILTFDGAYKVIESELCAIESIAKSTLSKNGFNYGAKAKLNNEYFPTRAYGDKVVESGYYDALIIELGSGKGDNWWCVVYPPLCFVSPSVSTDFHYKSLIVKLWDKFFS